MPCGNLEKYKDVCIVCGETFYGIEGVCKSCIPTYKKYFKGSKVLMVVWVSLGSKPIHHEMTLNQALAYMKSCSSFWVKIIDPITYILLYEKYGNSVTE